MADSVRKVQYAYVMVPNRPGQGAKVLSELQAAGVDLLVYSGFPGKRGAQIDLVTRDMPGLKRVARRNGWQLSRTKRASWSRARIASGPSTGNSRASRPARSTSWPPAR